MKSHLHGLATLSLPLALAVAATACDSEPGAPPPECASGTICTWAGNGEPAFNGDGLDRREAMLYWPMDLAFAPDGRAYILDWQNHRVRRVNEARRVRDRDRHRRRRRRPATTGDERMRARASPAPTATSTTPPT